MTALARELPEPLAGVARSWALGGQVKDPVAVAAELSAEYWKLPATQRSYSAAVHIVAARRKIAPIPTETDSGPVLFEAILSTLRAHYYFESEWHYVLVALFILQARIVSSLPAVFYLFFGGRFGTGKTNILRLIADLTDGILLENVSVTALARMVQAGKVICIDEFDVPRGREVDEIRDALVRQGYKATAAPYARWDVSAKEVEYVPIYGPKALAFRGAIEDALQSRGFLIPTASPAGEGAYSLVLRNLFPELGAIGARTDLWGKRAVVEYPAERVRAVAESAEFRGKVQAVVRELGANRESELMTAALLTAEIAGVAVLATLRSAAERREAAAAEAEDDAIGELADTVTDLSVSAPQPLSGADGFTRLKQAAVLEELNRRRRAAGKHPFGSRALAKYRRELGVKDSWLQSIHKTAWWHLPGEFVSSLVSAHTAAESPPLGPLSPPGPPSRHDSEGELGEPGGQAPASARAPPLPTARDPGDLFGGRPTRTDALRGKDAGL